MSSTFLTTKHLAVQTYYQGWSEFSSPQTNITNIWWKYSICGKYLAVSKIRKIKHFTLT